MNLAREGLRLLARGGDDRVHPRRSSSGIGLLDYDFIVTELGSYGRNVHQIIEHWLTTEKTLARLCELEEILVRDSVAHLNARHRLTTAAQYPIEETNHG